MLSTTQSIKDFTAKKLLEKVKFLHSNPKRCLDYISHATNTTHCLKSTFPEAEIHEYNNKKDNNVLNYSYDFVYSHWLFPCDDYQEHFTKIAGTLEYTEPWFFTALGQESLIEYQEYYYAKKQKRPIVPWVDICELGDKIAQAGFVSSVLEAQKVKFQIHDQDELWQAIAEIYSAFDAPMGEIEQIDDSNTWVNKDNTLTIELIIGIAFMPKAFVNYLDNNHEVTIKPEQIKSQS